MQRNCASGLQALDCAARDIACGRSDLILAGGCEAMSRAPLLFSPAAVRWFASLRTARGLAPRSKRSVPESNIKVYHPSTYTGGPVDGAILTDSLKVRHQSAFDGHIQIGWLAAIKTDHDRAGGGGFIAPAIGFN